MKKLIAVMMVLVLVLTFPTSSTAVGVTNTPNVEVKTNHEYAFTYTEYTDADHNIIRTYSKQENTAISAYARTASYNATSAISTEEGTRAILTSLGMSQDFVNELSEKDLEEYANSEFIISTVTYLATDENGEIITIPEDEAQLLSSPGPNVEEDLPDEGGDFFSGGKIETFNDNRLRITFIITYRGEGRYKFSIDAEWLDDPLWHFTDTLGACAQNFAIEDSTRAGWYMYDMQTCNQGDYMESTDRKVTLTNFQNVRGNGNWDGSAAVFRLYSDVYTDLGNYTLYNNHRIHYEFEATIHQWQIATNFNATATYSQRRMALTISPSISISATEQGVGIGLDVNSFLEKYIVSLNNSIAHTP